jgi:hypothetical protein
LIYFKFLKDYIISYHQKANNIEAVCWPVHLYVKASAVGSTLAQYAGMQWWGYASIDAYRYSCIQNSTQRKGPESRFPRSSESPLMFTAHLQLSPRNNVVVVIDQISYIFLLLFSPALIIIIN